jgi:hypothetical protein
MPEPPALHPGDPYYCPRCHTPHVIELQYADRSTAQRTHLYITLSEGNDTFSARSPWSSASHQHQDRSNPGNENSDERKNERVCVQFHVKHLGRPLRSLDRP